MKSAMYRFFPIVCRHHRTGDGGFFLFFIQKQFTDTYERNGSIFGIYTIGIASTTYFFKPGAMGVCVHECPLRWLIMMQKLTCAWKADFWGSSKNAFCPHPSLLRHSRCFATIETADSCKTPAMAPRLDCEQNRYFWRRPLVNVEFGDGFGR